MLEWSPGEGSSLNIVGTFFSMPKPDFLIIHRDVVRAREELEAWRYRVEKSIREGDLAEVIGALETFMLTRGIK